MQSNFGNSYAVRAMVEDLQNSITSWECDDEQLEAEDNGDEENEPA